jgi:hypothetical protein
MIACPERIGSVTLTMNLRLFTVSEPRVWATFQHFSHLWSTIPTFMMMTLMVFHIRRLHNIARYTTIMFLRGWTGDQFDTSPEGEFFWYSTSASALAVWNWESCYWIDMSKRWWGKQKAAHLDSLVRCNRSLPDSFLLHSHRPTYRFHKYCFCMDLRRS